MVLVEKKGEAIDSMEFFQQNFRSKVELSEFPWADGIVNNKFCWKY